MTQDSHNKEGGRTDGPGAVEAEGVGTIDQKRILIVEDNQEMARAVAAHLGRWGYVCDLAHTAEDGLKKLLLGGYALAILDIILGPDDGLELCKEARRQKVSIPILMLTSKTEEIDIILGLDAGADDYLSKPFKVGELEARIRALLRRTASSSAQTSEETVGDLRTFGDCVIDRLRRTVSVRGSKVELTAREYEILCILSDHPGKPFTRAEILETLGEPSAPNYEYTVNTVIWRLRTKIEDDPENPRYIKTVRGTGYRFAEPSELSSSK